ncbi:uncharacterized protein LOC106158519 [Lingula anatina]|uniref:Uncharacterized protein LOC106158519 n=1 Tax=Lingula anatina TaxID=7574 RepID=A0A1S3HVD6_LINAN|nr:uncharacterized protein LOC106158519 [Lingula anatina]|eukprot:XP_013390000.1 uncharacterized protein LOC106158519 [Lingula anatina]
MKPPAFGLATVFLLILQFSTRVKSSMVCFACGQQANIIINSRCGDPFISDTNGTNARSIQILHCDNGCSKFKAEIDGRQLVMRGCALTGVQKEHCRELRHHGVLGEMCQCSSDRCNTATSGFFSVVFVFYLQCAIVSLIGVSGMFPILGQ